MCVHQRSIHRYYPSYSNRNVHQSFQFFEFLLLHMINQIPTLRDLIHSTFPVPWFHQLNQKKHHASKIRIIPECEIISAVLKWVPIPNRNWYTDLPTGKSVLDLDNKIQYLPENVLDCPQLLKNLTLIPNHQIVTVQPPEALSKRNMFQVKHASSSTPDRTPKTCHKSRSRVKHLPDLIPVRNPN